MLPEAMTAAVLYGPGDLRVESRPVPELRADHVTVLVGFCGICGTDLHYWDGWRFDAWLRNFDQPWVLGHEFTGIVASVGPGVDDLGVGQAVVADPWTACGECRMCARGQDNFCENKHWLDQGGAWAEYVVADRHNLFPLPATVDPAVATLTEPLACVLRGYDRITPHASDRVFIAGAGPIGLLTVQVAKHMGAAHVVVSEPQATRRAIASELGADTVLDPTRDDVGQAVRDLTCGLGADLTIEAAGVNPAFRACLDTVRESGTILVLSVGNPATTFELRPFDLFAHELQIVGSNTRLKTFQRALDLIPSLHLDPIITHRFPLAEAERAVRTAKAGQGAKVLLDCGGASAG